MIKVNEDDCIGCGLCADIAPETFKINDDTGLAVVINSEVTDEAVEALHSCPVVAIEVEK